MKAMLLEKTAPIDTDPLRMVERPEPKPGRGEVLVKVAACGVCRSNLHMIEGDWVGNGVPAKLPIIPGHEIVGRVAAVGVGVEGIAVGARVGVQPLWTSCERCEYCLTGREPLCPYKEITGETVDGGYAEYLVAKERHIYLVPESVSDAEGAPLFCPGITAFGAVSKARLAPGKALGLFGFGGVGHMVQQLAQLAGADVSVVARSAGHLALAKKLGAARTIDSSKADAVDVLRKSGGVDAAIVFAPSTALLREAIRATKPGGVIVVGALADVGELPFVEEKTVVGTLLGSRQQMHELLRLAGEGKVRAVVETLPLERAGEALRRMKRGEIEARAVVVL
ncbi:MAG TPA: alcohol dehydrogenase catalytic domain-containing protein [Polyangiaceae bacterium]|jgi:propanol-preferring alcohol dehydrogenase|nr:alcohol dehydrogenase catalytic domain-containing protein [Polyangiaceae bacterium]